MRDDPYFSFTDDERAYLESGREAFATRLSRHATPYEAALYEVQQEHDIDLELVRPSFVRDVDRILNNAFFNRCSDKTQVFPFYRNDDLTRRSFHLQLVSQVARKIGTALRLNNDLIEAIALGHDMGHTPFGHGGEDFLSRLYRQHTGRFFNHNVHSVRVFKDVSQAKLSLQTLHGILSHCGEKSFVSYYPGDCCSFEDLGREMEHCYTNEEGSQDLKPNTLEGCVVRISDVIAYLGKDRQDALSVGVLSKDRYEVEGNILGKTNRDIIRNVTTNIIKNSIEKDHLKMDEEVFEAIVRIREENYATIYSSKEAHGTLDSYIQPMMERLYETLLEDVKCGNEDSFIYRHHIDSWVMAYNPTYRDSKPDDIVVDYIASMTDDYFIDLYNRLFPEDAKDKERMYHSYFES